MADIGDTVAPKADQMVNEDLMSGPRTFTVSRVVVKPNAEQPVDVYLEEFGPLPYRPSKGMRDVMLAAWGRKSATYAGKRLTLYRDAGVKFGTTVWGGIRISHMSDLPDNKPLPVQLRISRGKKGPHVVKPLVDPRIAALRAEWETADPERRAAIEAEVKALNTTNEEK